MEAITSNCIKTGINDLTHVHLNSLDSINLIVIKTFSTAKFYNLNSDVYNLNLIILQNLVKYYSENIRNGKIMANYSSWNRSISKIVEFSVQKIYEEQEKKYIRLRFNYICYFLKKIKVLIYIDLKRILLKLFKILFQHVNEFKKEKYGEKLMFSIKRILITIDQSSKFRKLDDDEQETKIASFNVIFEVFKSKFVINYEICLFIFFRFEGKFYKFPNEKFFSYLDKRTKFICNFFG